MNFHTKRLKWDEESMQFYLDYCRRAILLYGPNLWALIIAQGMDRTRVVDLNIIAAWESTKTWAILWVENEYRPRFHNTKCPYRRILRKKNALTDSVLFYAPLQAVCERDIRREYVITPNNISEILISGIRHPNTDHRYNISGI